ncbi:YqaA family protein [Candidatus Pelagibacter sp.]|uniref:YqaA family protein n=1 Tax=Candidatus Pelagibacter sp. TaxID=2024849 RepID=UPI003F860E9F
MIIGYLSLFTISFLAATILPFSSELILASMLSIENYNRTLLITFSSLGNILGSVFNWVLGFYFIKLQNKKWFPFNQEQISKSSQWFEKYGKWSLLFAWVPIIGDPLTFVAGTMKTKFFIFLILVGIGKISRYLFISLLV